MRVVYSRCNIRYTYIITYNINCKQSNEKLTSIFIIWTKILVFYCERLEDRFAQNICRKGDFEFVNTQPTTLENGMKAQFCEGRSIHRGRTSANQYGAARSLSIIPQNGHAPATAWTRLPRQCHWSRLSRIIRPFRSRYKIQPIDRFPNQTILRGETSRVNGTHSCTERNVRLKINEPEDSTSINQNSG